MSYRIIIKKDSAKTTGTFTRTFTIQTSMYKYITKYCGSNYYNPGAIGFKGIINSPNMSQGINSLEEAERQHKKN